MDHFEESLARNPLTQLLAGMSYPFRAVMFMRQHRLWRLALAPVCVNALLLVLLSFGIWFNAWPWLQSVELYVQSMVADPQAMHGVLVFFTWLIWLILLPVVFVACAMVIFLVGQVVASPFLDMLSEQVECTVLQQPTAPFTLRRWFDSVVVALGDAVWGVFYLVLIYIPLLCLSFLPGVGAIASVAFGALLLSQEFVGLPMARRLVSYRARWRQVMANKWFCFGFGSVATLLVIVPGLNLVLLPVACVGGTLLYCDLQRAGRLTSP